MKYLYYFGQLINCDDVDLPNCGETNQQSNVQGVLDTVFIITGFLSVLFILIGAFRLVVSGGSADQVKSARETILYAVIGLVVSVGSFLIVRTVLGQL